MSSGTVQPLFRVPPFPGSRPASLIRSSRTSRYGLTEAQLDELLTAIADSRVGGTYWGSRPNLPAAPYSLICVSDARLREQLIAEFPHDRTLLCWISRGSRREISGTSAYHVFGTCDPWHLLSGAADVIADAHDEVAVIAALMAVPLKCVGEGPFTPLASGAGPHVLRQVFRSTFIDPFTYLDPFSEKQLSLLQVVEISRFWRNLIDGNRDIHAALGFAFWKRPTVAPLLWAGAADVPFVSEPTQVQGEVPVAVWRSRVSVAALKKLEAKRARLIEVEDGFIRSVGLGADCVPPLSIVVDRLGPHFDPGQPSELEFLLENGEFDSELLERAQRLRDLIIASGVSKYAAGAGRGPAHRRVIGRKHILVPGQVEDDRSMLTGGTDVKTNLELLRRAREQEPGAYILYKPHPDVEAGHRTGSVPDETVLFFADEVVRDSAISPLIDMVDELHVTTSLAGFEALLRGKRVTTHGVPFYAGWGLTRDLGPVPGRRTKRRSLNELVAAVLLLYPRYLDPETGLPCPPEVLIRRLSQTTSLPRTGAVVRLRRFQGLVKRVIGLRPRR